MAGYISSPPPPAPLILTDEILMSGGSGVLVANTVYVLELIVPWFCTAAVMRWKMAATVTGTTDAGLYDASGNQLSHTGAITNVASSNNGSALLANVSLRPGQKIFLAMTSSNSTDTYFRVNSFGTTNPIVAIYTAANGGTAGVLPATLGTLTQSGTMPVIAAALSGGI